MEKKDANGTLEEGIAGLKPILESIREAVIVADPQGTIRLVNAASELITGYLPEELIGRSLKDVCIFSCATTDVSWFLPEALAGWRAVELPQDCFVTRFSGSLLPVSASAVPLYSAQGDYQGIVLVIRDITEEAKLKRRQYEFLSFVSHQLRQPLGSFHWGLEILLREGDDFSPQHREILNDLMQITSRFIDFIKDLVDISRFEEGRVELQIEPVDIRLVAKETAKELEGLATSQNVSVRLFFASDSHAQFIINADKARVHDVFSNLLVNAIRYNKPRGEVVVEARVEDARALQNLAAEKRGGKMFESLHEVISRQGPEGKLLLISVSDTGLGIPEEQQKNIFESFFRGGNVIAKGLQGSGLGLFIVKSIVEKLGGSAFFESKENEGTTFYLIFPPK